jgi:N-acetylmuramoyl-L-alanine amidase
VHEDPSAEGTTVFYYGREDYESRGGRRLAELVQAELGPARVEGRPCHPKSLPMLRETRMPAVHVEPCFLTNPREEQLLGTDTFVGAAGTRSRTGSNGSSTRETSRQGRR